MKTALEEIIEYVTKYEELIGATATMVKDKATNLLEKEKRDIVEAVDYGKKYNKDFDFTGEQYFQENFKKD